MNFSHHQRITAQALSAAGSYDDEVKVATLDDMGFPIEEIICLSDERGDKESLDCYVERLWLLVGQMAESINELEAQNIELRAGMVEIGMLKSDEPEETPVG